VLIEDADLYRFLIEGAANIFGRTLTWAVPKADEFPPTYLPPVPGERPQINPDWLAFLADLRDLCARDLPELAWIADGRTPWDVFGNEQIIGNQRIDPCSKILKRQMGERWLAENCAPADTVLIFGIHWEEEHRLFHRAKDGKPRGVQNRYKELGWPHVDATMCWGPWMSVQDITAWAKLEGLGRPRLYDLGFAHNNCGGFCVKAGEGHFVHLLRTKPELYAHHEAQEEAFNAARPGKKRQTVLAPERVVGVKTTVETDLNSFTERRVHRPDRRRVPMTMREFREAANAGEQVDLFDTGGCDCFYPEEEAA
jgi:hypothetical protein